jgi:hypothetical protein
LPSLSPQLESHRIVHVAQSPPVQVSAGTKVTRFLATAGFAESLELRAKATLSAAQCAAYAYANVDMVKWGAAGKGTEDP